MISITIEGNAQQVREEMRALLGQDRETASFEQTEDAQDKPSPEKPKATRSTKAKGDTAAKTAEPTSEQDKAPSGETTSASSATSATTSPSDGEERDLSEKAMRERITQYSAKAGPVALTEMQGQAGAPNGKFSEIMADPERITKLDALLADAGF
jgi:hypothetical protein